VAAVLALGTALFNTGANVAASQNPKDIVGVWRVENEAGKRYVVGTFEQLNTFADSHQPTDTLSVSLKVQVSDENRGFAGLASARVGTQTVPSYLSGVRAPACQKSVF